MQATQQPPADGDRDHPGSHPPEIVPNEGDFDRPDRAPPEISPDQGDTDRPDAAPIETPVPPDQPAVPPPD
jgi:hypothetical protein